MTWFAVKPTSLVTFFGSLALFLAAAIAEPNEQRDRATIISRIARQPVHSSAIAAIGYSKRLHALEIEFVNGAIYRYLEVPPFIYRSLMSADSKARFYDGNIRGKYRSFYVQPRAK